MAKTTYRGVHGTCITHAKSIVANGMRAATEGRAGAGAYLWSYASDPDQAIALAEDWHQDDTERGHYQGLKEPGLAVLFFEIDLEPLELVNLNSTAHHELIRKKLGRNKGKSAISKCFDDHIKGIADHRVAEKGITLKMVEATLPYPQSTKQRWDSVPLTTGGDAYIILYQGLSALRLVDARGVALKG